MIFLKSIQKNEVKNVLLIKNVGGGHDVHMANILMINMNLSYKMLGCWS